MDRIQIMCLDMGYDSGYVHCVNALLIQSSLNQFIVCKRGSRHAVEGVYSTCMHIVKNISNDGGYIF